MISRTGGLLALALLASCGGGGTFTPVTPPASTCALLTPDDLATILPEAMGGEYPISQGPDLWTGNCYWFAAGVPMIFQVTVYGATTARGLRDLWPASLAGAVRTPVTGLGTAAQYWEEGGAANGLWAIEGSTSVNLSASVFRPLLTEAQLHPLVAKVLGQLQ